MTVAAASSLFLIPPSAALLLYTLVWCALVCAVKGRWGYLVAGLFTLGVCLIVGAPASPRAGSIWSRTSLRRHPQS